MSTLRRKTNLGGRLDRGRRSPSIYSRTETQEEPKRGHPFLLFIFFALLAGLGYVIFFSPLLSIDNISVSGTKFVSQEWVEGEVAGFIDSNFLNRNLLTFSSAGLMRRLGENRSIKEVIVEKKWYHGLDIAITENNPAIVWETLGKIYMVNESGIVTEEYGDKYKDFPIITDAKNVPVEIGKKILTPGFTAFAKELSETFYTMTNSKIKKIEVPEITSELKVTSSSGWYVLFDTTRTVRNQLISLSRVLAETRSKQRKLEYVDLRIDSRIFYK